ncbi:gamma-2-syntrophin-like isoform X2 [Varroa destructor]|uniref:PDZ domain-containing protein n=1 Tax=Varroa destructor TaxID=109461 RepID=A0A7M7JH90_VARDE|nr:gamma-2-syntrophin-like isoform X2 [Varroa destructor]
MMFICSSNGKHRVTVQLELRDHVLLIIPNAGGNSNKYSVPNKERVIALPRRPEGGFGVAIKGGHEHNLPIIISKILRADSSSIKLYVGDAIVKVNEVPTRGLSREQATELLRSAGERVILTVKHYREVASLLKKEMEEQRAFKVQACSSKEETIVQCTDRGERETWLRTIHAAVQRCNDHKIEQLNRNQEEANKIHWMDWISKKCYFPWNRQRTLPLFLALKGASVYQFDRAPASLTEFDDCQIVYKAYQCSLQPDAECIDLALTSRHYVLETPHHCVRFSLPPGGQSTAVLERAWALCTYLSVITLSSKTFSVQFENKAASLTIDWNMGFALYDIASKEYLWKYGFAQYRSNGQDGARVSLVFALKDTACCKNELLRTVTLNNDAQAKQFIFCINAFLSSKSVAPH